MRIDFAVKQHMQWYKGDGIYGDGNEFHFDYYNSFVIQPMLVDILNTVGHEYEDWAEVTEIVKKRFSHYASVLEGLIGPGRFLPRNRPVFRLSVRDVSGAVTGGFAKSVRAGFILWAGALRPYRCDSKSDAV